MKRPGLDWAGLARLVETRVLVTIALAAGALGAFTALAGEVLEGETGKVDRAILMSFRVPGHPDLAIGPRWVQEAARDVTALGGFTVLTLISVFATILLLAHRRRLQALTFAATVVAAQILSEVLKVLIGRPRPDLVTHLDLVYSRSFPSGHAMMTPVVYLTLAGIVAAGERQRSVKALLLGGAAALTALVGLSRVYLGVHWPTDVLGGWTLGAALALAGTLFLRAASPAITEPASAATRTPG